MSNIKKAHWRVVTPNAWPAPPAEMSVSTYAEIQECPRRWALSAADYPELWSGRGYPARLQVSALAGSVVHLALEIITRQFARGGVVSLTDPAAPKVMRDLGGYTRVVEESVDRILKRYVANPRAGALIEHAQRTLLGQIPMLGSRVQSMVSRLRLPKGVASRTAAAVIAPTSGGPPPRLPLVNGIYPEIEVRAKSIGWKAKVDLLILDDDACEITDFKTGSVEETHEFQVRAYAVMWGLDDELNPSRRTVDRLMLAYESRDVDVAPPSPKEINELGRELLERRQAAEIELAARPPSAHPNTETCRYCGVRQLCDAYWSSTMQVVSDDGRFGDIELVITGRHGPRSWDAVVLHARDLPAKKPALLRVQTHDELDEGMRVRVLDGAISRDPEDDDAPAIVTLGVLSEAYIVPHGHDNEP